MSTHNKEAAEREAFDQHWAVCGFVPEGANPDHIYAAMKSGFMAVRSSTLTASEAHDQMTVKQPSNEAPATEQSPPLPDRARLTIGELQHTPVYTADQVLEHREQYAAWKIAALRSEQVPPTFNSLGIAENWSVTVEACGTPVLTIGQDYYSGVHDLEPYKETIANCARHLLSFIGRDSVQAPAGEVPSDETLAAMLVASDMDPAIPKLTDEEMVSICEVRGWSITAAPPFRDVAHAFYAEGCAAQRRAISTPPAVPQEWREFMQECVDFWRNFSCLDEPSQEDLMDEKDAMLELMMALLSAAHATPQSTQEHPE